MKRSANRGSIAYRAAIAGIIAAGVAAPFEAKADPIAPPQFAAWAGGAFDPGFELVNPFVKVGSTPQSDSVLDPAGHFSASATTAGFAEPNLRVSGFADSPVANPKFGASASITYQFNILGPPGVKVPVIFQATGGLDAARSIVGPDSLYEGFALAELGGNSPFGGTLFAARACVAHTPGACGSQ